jgi:hypothetical protein
LKWLTQVKLIEPTMQYGIIVNSLYNIHQVLLVSTSTVDGNQVPHSQHVIVS